MQFLWTRNFGWIAKKNIPNGVSAEEIEKWVQDTLDKFIDVHVWARYSDASTVSTLEHENIVSIKLQLKLSNGSTDVIFVQQKQKQKVVQKMN